MIKTVQPRKCPHKPLRTQKSKNYYTSSHNFKRRKLPLSFPILKLQPPHTHFESIVEWTERLCKHAMRMSLHSQLLITWIGIDLVLYQFRYAQLLLLLFVKLRPQRQKPWRKTNEKELLRDLEASGCAIQMEYKCCWTFVLWSNSALRKRRNATRIESLMGK